MHAKAVRRQTPVSQGAPGTRIWLESLDPEFPSWDLDPDEDKYQIVAEFVQVVE